MFFHLKSNIFTASKYYCILHVKENNTDMNFNAKHVYIDLIDFIERTKMHLKCDEALIAETVVWPNFFLMNVFFALKGSKLFYYHFLSLQLDVVPCVGRKKSPRTHL